MTVDELESHGESHAHRSCSVGAVGLGAIDEADDEQNDAGANEGIDDRAEDSATNQNTDCRQQPSRDDGTDNSENDIADESEPAAFHDLACKPACNGANDEPNDKRFDCHGVPLKVVLNDLCSAECMA
jgi:hypothetical protein